VRSKPIRLKLGQLKPLWFGLLLALSGCGDPSPPFSSVTPSPTPTPSVVSPAPGQLASPGRLEQAERSEKSERSEQAGQSATPAPSAQSLNAPSSQADQQTPAPAGMEAVRVLSCQTTSGIVNDPNAPLNVRRTPDSSQENVVRRLSNGELVEITGKTSDWWQISQPVTGWVSQNLIDTTCNEQIAQVEFPPNKVSINLQGRLIGTGYHRYQLEAAAGQVLTIISETSEPILPFVIAPNGQELGGESPAGATQWSGTLPDDGTYLLEFDSNFKGFEYQVSVTVQ